MHKIPEHLAALSGKLLKSIVKTGIGTASSENKRRADNVNNANNANDDDDETIILDPLTTIMRLATLHLRPKGTKLSFTKHSMLFDLPTTPVHWQGIWRTLASLSGIHSCRNDLSVLKNAILSFRTQLSTSSNIAVGDVDDKTTVRHAKFTTAAIKGLTQLKQCYDEISNDPIVHCIEFYIALLKEPPRSPMLVSLTSPSSSSMSSLSISSDSEPIENEETKEDDEKKEDDEITSSCNNESCKLWSESKEVLIYSLLIEAENQDEQKNYTTVHTLINSIDLLLADADRELERALKN